MTLAVSHKMKLRATAGNYCVAYKVEVKFLYLLYDTCNRKHVERNKKSVSFHSLGFMHLFKLNKKKYPCVNIINSFMLGSSSVITKKQSPTIITYSLCDVPVQASQHFIMGAWKDCGFGEKVKKVKFQH